MGHQRPQGDNKDRQQEWPDLDRTTWQNEGSRPLGSKGSANTSIAKEIDVRNIKDQHT